MPSLDLPQRKPPIFLSGPPANPRAFHQSSSFGPGYRVEWTSTLDTHWSKHFKRLRRCSRRTVEIPRQGGIPAICPIGESSSSQRYADRGRSAADYDANAFTRTWSMYEFLYAVRPRERPTITLDALFFKDDDHAETTGHWFPRSSHSSFEHQGWRARGKAYFERDLRLRLIRTL